MLKFSYSEVPFRVAGHVKLKQNDDFYELSGLLQSQHDYLLGNYPVGREDAAQLAALQIIADVGSIPNPETST
jgi:hypothetical protein